MATRVCCSIEMEPKTLSQVQLNHAREMAADVVQKTESNEASVTFSEGLRPIYSTRQMERQNTDKEGEEAPNKLVLELEIEETQVLVSDTPCQCLCGTADIETPDQEKLKEPLSAPF